MPDNQSAASLNYQLHYSNRQTPENISYEEAFSTKEFRKISDIVVASLEQYLQQIDPVCGLNLTEPAILIEKARSLMTHESEEIAAFDETRLRDIIELYTKTGIQVHSKGYMGRQFSGVLPLSGIFDLVNATVNQPSSFYEAAQLPNVAELIMQNELNKFIGYTDNSFAMVTTSGGSLANLTALLSARNYKYPNVWNSGLHRLHENAIPAVAISENAHYSIKRAIGIMGIGEDQLVKLPVNGKNQIDSSKVESCLKKAREQGLRVFCMVASACTTDTGSFDPLDELAAIAQEHDSWLHVDGAHGASLLLSEKHRHKLKGLEKADSFIWDAHKMLFTPGTCTLLFYKNKERSYGAFRQEASYVFEKQADIYTSLDSGEQNFECTKRPVIMNLWVSWAMHGKAVFSKKIDHLCHLANQAWNILLHEGDFQVIHEPQANILCFRYTPANLDLQTNKHFQLYIRNKIKEEGRFFISKVEVNGEEALRVVFMNHEIEMIHFRMLLQEIRKTGQEMIISQTNIQHQAIPISQ
ncbi:pyridoxal phosphate-dependent decarboxylase family protein [Filimonas effusa]|uniref:Aminotransferase class I/II-fold pyridoxal phosphate-dependent enzyme n=1 Tax=Filimonas effusa TaxID=2508721 RepID=A0A4Q1D9F4_9BACT|nr:aminotransferase class I/II-fold pyridoxal phosphate-dependent enzyme [Filimonas effusa]RXK85971.1 aminotransferase class I/II-fold pyridoxal phosphate-dependent enzyme [Filimonas effusa]